MQLIFIYYIDYNKRAYQIKMEKIFVKIVTDLSNLNLNGLNLKGIQIPLLLDCGHPVCSKCAKREIMKTCPSCKTVLDNSLKFLLPLNLYALGLIVSSYHCPLENDDDEFLFCHQLSSQSRQIAKQGQRMQRIIRQNNQTSEEENHLMLAFGYRM